MAPAGILPAVPRPSHERWWIQPPVLGAFFAITAIALLATSVLISGRPLTVESLMAGVYRAGQLISLNQEEPDPARYPDPDSRLVLGFAQVLAVCAVAMLAFEFFRLVGGRAYERLRVVVRRIARGPRILVVGDGPASRAVVDSIFGSAAARGGRVLVTLLRTDDDDSSLVHPMGALMIVRRSEASADDLRMLDAGRMSAIVVAGESDASNLASVASCIRALDAGSRVPISVRIDSPECAAQVRAAAAAAPVGAPLGRVRVFCPDAIAARLALARWDRGRHGCRLLLVGFGASASAFLAEWLRRVPAGAIAEVVAIDPRADHSLERFEANHRDVAGSGRFRVVREPVHPALLRAEIERMAAESSGDFAVSVSIGDVDRNLAISLLAASTARRAGAAPGQATVFLRQSLLNDIGVLLDSEGTDTHAGIRAWGGLADSFAADSVLDDRPVTD